MRFVGLHSQNSKCGTLVFAVCLSVLDFAQRLSVLESAHSHANKAVIPQQPPNPSESYQKL